MLLEIIRYKLKKNKNRLFVKASEDFYDTGFYTPSNVLEIYCMTEVSSVGSYSLIPYQTEDQLEA